MSKPHSLETVLKLRKLVEQQEERLLEKMLAESARLDGLVQSHRESIAAAYRARPLGEQVAAWEMLSPYAAVPALNERVTTLEGQKAKLAALSDQQRNVLLNKRQERETAESLVEARRLQVEVAEHRREQRFLDDAHAAQRQRRQPIASQRPRQARWFGE